MGSRSESSTERQQEQSDELHARACERGQPGYADPVSGLFVLTAKYLAERGHCCRRGCRHCPYRELARRRKAASSAANRAG